MDLRDDQRIERGSFSGYCCPCYRSDTKFSVKIIDPIEQKNVKQEKVEEYKQLLDSVYKNDYLVHMKFIKFHCPPGCDIGQLRIVSEWTDMTLPDYFRTRRNDAITHWLSLMKDMALGLKALHDAGVLHHDLCPKNVLVTIDTDNNTPHCKLAEFNLRLMLGLLPKTQSSGLGSNPEPDCFRPSEYFGEPVPIDKEYDIASLALIYLTILQQNLANGESAFIPKIEGELLDESDKQLPIGSVLYMQAELADMGIKLTKNGEPIEVVKIDEAKDDDRIQNIKRMIQKAVDHDKSIRPSIDEIIDILS